MIVTKYLLIYKMEKNQNLLINTLSGAVDIVDDTIKNCLEHQNIPENKDIVEKLTKRKYLLKNEDEEKEIFQSYKKYLHFLKCEDSNVRRLAFVLCPTYNCNLRCTYCFENHSMHKMNTVMTEAQVDDAFEMMEKKILPFMDANDYIIQLFGGEPIQSITKDIVKYIFDKTKIHNTRISITTNGTNIENFMDIFQENKDRVSFQITLDGIKEIHDKNRIKADGKGTFDLIVSNINLLLENGFKVQVRVNTNVNSVQYIPQLIELYEKFDWYHKKNFNCVLSPISEHNAMPTCATVDEFEIFEEIYKRYPDLELLKEKYKITVGADMYRIVGHLNRMIKPNIVPRYALPSIAYCESALLKMFFFGPDGLIYPCAETIGEEKCSIASYYPKKEIFDEKINQWKDRTIFDMKECSECNIATLCGGGCSFAALKFKGDARKGFCGNARSTIDKYINNALKLSTD